MNYILALLFSLSALGATLPTLPQASVDTTLQPVTGKSIPVNAGGDLQAAINAAAPGDELVLQAGAAFVGNYELPNKPGSGGVTIRSSAMGKLPVSGNRVAPTDAVNMPTIIASGVSTAFHFANGAHNYRLMGLEITEQPKQSLSYGLIMQGDPNDTNPADLPNHITIDRCYLHGRPLSHIKFGWQMNGSYLAIIDSYVSEFHGLGQDTQAITGYMGTGPMKIVNNFLEGAGENILFGGASDAIPNTITADVTFTGNYLYKPDSWRTQPLIPQAQHVSAVGNSTGSLAAGSYYYAVIAEGTVGTLDSLPGQAQSSRSAEVSATLAAPGSVTIAFTEATYGDALDTRLADHYTICRTPDAPGSPTRNWTYFDYTPANALSFVDNGTATPLSGFDEWTREWTVKNLFEIKNGERWLVRGNIMEGNWVSAQSGFSILFTPRNENPGFMAGNHIWDITFQDNIVRHVAGGVNIGSEDDTMVPVASSLGIDLSKLIPTARIQIVNNLFEDVNWSYNGNGIFFNAGQGVTTGLSGAQDITLDHNTVFQTGNFAGLGCCTGLAMPNFTFTNNIFQEGSYGWFVSGQGQSLSALQMVLNPLTFTHNVWAGDPAPYQIANNLYPNSLNDVGFVNYSGGNGGDYHLAPGSPYKGAASDGADPGANIDTLNGVLAQAIAGQTAPISVPVVTPPPPPITVPPPALPTVWVRILSLNSGKCLTPQADGTIQQFACAAANNAQLVTLIPAYDANQKLLGYQFLFKNAASLDVWGASGANGAVVGQYGFKGASNEIFSLHQNAGGFYTITANNSGKCLDITGISKLDGARLQQWDCGIGTNQQWSLLVQSVQ